MCWLRLENVKGPPNGQWAGCCAAIQGHLGAAVRMLHSFCIAAYASGLHVLSDDLNEP